VRRVVTGTGPDGKAVIVSDGKPPRCVERIHISGFSDTMVWATQAPVASRDVTSDPTLSRDQWIPAPGETLALVVTFPPDSVFTDPHFDAAEARREHLAATPGLAELFEEGAPGMHATPSVDYAVVLNGRLLLDLDDGETTELGPGDVVVQNGVRHAWRNPTSEPATIFVVLVGCRP